MKFFIIPAFLLCLIFISCGSPSNTAKDKTEEKTKENTAEPGAADKEFVKKAADGGMLEVKLGLYAATHARSAEIKEMGQQIAEDHGKANAELKALAMKKNISLSDSLSSQARMKYEELAQKTGTAFDDAYTKAMAEDHKKDIDLFEQQAQNGSDEELKKWAEEKLPVLRHHLMMAENVKNK